MTHFNKGPSYGLSAEVKNKIASKYDHQAEEDLRNWIEEVTGMSIGANFQLGLKDGIILCELINKLQPGSVKKVNESSLNWPQVTAKPATPDSSWLLFMQQELDYSF